MAVVKVDEIAAGRRANDNLKWVKEYVRVFQVFTDSALDDPMIVMAAGGIPQLYDTYINAAGTAVDPSSVVKYREPLQDADNPLKWLVRIQYTSNVDEILAANPLSRPAKISRKTEKYTRSIFQDVNGAAILNAAGQPFNPPPEVDDFRYCIEVEKNFLSVDDLDIGTNYLNRVNSAPFLGINTGYLKLSDFSANTVVEYPISYQACKFTFHANPLTWTLQLLNQGFYQKVSGNLRRVVDPFTGQPLSAAALLASDGTQLTVGGTPVFLPFTIYSTADFNALNILP